MQAPAIRRLSRTESPRHAERGITMVLVAVAMVAIIAIAALSIDVVTLYLAREEAQRSADAAALAAARVISISGITGTADPASDPTSWAKICGGPTSAATQTAQAVGIQNAVGSIAANVVVTYSTARSAANSDCSGLLKAFAVNPLVTVQVTRASLPTFFSRIWGNTGNSVSATATAEAFNPSGSVGPTPLEPRCVKPWVVPNRDPLNPGPGGGGYCTGNGCQTLVGLSDGSITHAGISLNGSGTSGVIGEHFVLTPDCRYSGPTCRWRSSPAIANHPFQNPHIPAPPNLEYLPALVGTPSSAAPTCTGASTYERAITGCDQSTNYQCGVQDQNKVDLSENPGGSGDTSNGVQCLIGEGDPTGTQPDGQDTLRVSTFPFQILAGSSSPLIGLRGNPISSSNSIASLPIYDDTQNLTNNGGQNSVTFVGFLQVFINSVDQYGNIDVTILNVSGCSNVSVGPPALGSSPVPVRLITPP